MKVRNSNYELMRIISMFMIVLWHLLIHGNVFTNCTSDALRTLLAILLFSLAAHVNSFILVMGYFQSNSKFKFRKLLSIIFQTIFYSLIVLIVGIKTNWISNPNIIHFITYLLPECIKNYWFIGCYLIVYVFSDYLNFLINNLNRIQLRNLLIISFLVFSISPFLTGYNIINSSYANIGTFFLLYMFGAYLRKYSLKDSKIFKNISITNYRLLLIGIFTFSFLFNYMFYKFGMSLDTTSNLLTELSRRILSANITKYSNPFIIIQSIAYFELFGTFEFKNKIINYISSCTFGVYLLHEHPVFRSNIYKLLKFDLYPFKGIKSVGYMFALMFIIFITGILVESLRKLFIFIYHKTNISSKIADNNKKLLHQINKNLTY